jgi:hypothetical protein
MMTDIPVFEGDRIIGYLDSDEIPSDLLREHAPFRLVTREPIRMLCHNEPLPATTTVSYVTLRWDLVGSQRPAKALYADRGRYRAFVLVVDDGIADLNNIKGFKWLAEYHGEQYPDQRLPSARETQ